MQVGIGSRDAAETWNVEHDGPCRCLSGEAIRWDGWEAPHALHRHHQHRGGRLSRPSSRGTFQPFGYQGARFFEPFAGALNSLKVGHEALKGRRIDGALAFQRSVA